MNVMISNCRRSAVAPSQATPKKLRTATLRARTTTSHGSPRSIYHQKKTSRHESRHAKEKSTATAETVFQPVATAQMTNKQIKFIQTFIHQQSTDSIVDMPTPNDRHHCHSQLHHLDSNQSTNSNQTSLVNSKKLLFIYYCFLFQIYLNRRCGHLLSLFDSNCFLHFYDHTKLIVLIKCKFLKILPSSSLLTTTVSSSSYLLLY